MEYLNVNDPSEPFIVTREDMEELLMEYDEAYGYSEDLESLTDEEVLRMYKDLIGA